MVHILQRQDGRNQHPLRHPTLYNTSQRWSKEWQCPAYRVLAPEQYAVCTCLLHKTQADLSGRVRGMHLGQPQAAGCGKGFSRVILQR